VLLTLLPTRIRGFVTADRIILRHIVLVGISSVVSCDAEMSIRNHLELEDMSSSEERLKKCRSGYKSDSFQTNIVAA
jgi:hypothetical protein